MVLTIDVGGLTIEAVDRVARHGEKVELSAAAKERITAVRGVLEEKLGTDEVIYGVNTGIGEFSETRLADSDVVDFQKWLVYNHAAGARAAAARRARAPPPLPARASPSLAARCRPLSARHTQASVRPCPRSSCAPRWFPASTSTRTATQRAVW